MQRKSYLYFVSFLLIFLSIWCLKLQSDLNIANDNMGTLRNKYIEFYNQMEKEGNI